LPVRDQQEEYANRRDQYAVHGNRSENKDILSVVMPARVFIERVRSGEINDLKTLVAGCWFAERQAAGKS
jgi:hypothetical protein